MIIKEFRIILPLSMEEYNLGQLYTVAKASANETGGGEGVQILKNEPFDNVPLFKNSINTGQYTYKIYHLSSKCPSYIRFLAPKNALTLHEESWNAYPYCKTVLSNPDYMKYNLYISIETIHHPDRGEKPNAHHLPAEKLRLRKVEYVDISSDPEDAKDYVEAEDPKLFQSKVTGRGPLLNGWQQTVRPVMCAYKLITVEFNRFGFQNKVESFIMKTQDRIISKFNKQVFCWMDNWYDMSLDDIRDFENRTKDELVGQLTTGETRGITANEE